MTTVAGPADAEELFRSEDLRRSARHTPDFVDVPAHVADHRPGMAAAGSAARQRRLGCRRGRRARHARLRVAAHVVALGPVRRLVLRTTRPRHDAPALLRPSRCTRVRPGTSARPTRCSVSSSRTTPGLNHLLPAGGPRGPPARQDFVPATCLAKAWARGQGSPEESDRRYPRRRQMPQRRPRSQRVGSAEGPAASRSWRARHRGAGVRRGAPGPAGRANAPPAGRCTGAEGSVGQAAPRHRGPGAPAAFLHGGRGPGRPDLPGR